MRDIAPFIVYFSKGELMKMNEVLKCLLPRYWLAEAHIIYLQFKVCQTLFTNLMSEIKL